MDASIVQTMVQFGGLGVLALFAGVMLRSFLTQLEGMTQLLQNHMSKLLERQELSNELLRAMLAEMKAHEERAVARQELLREEVRQGNK